jgi:hypothetical protein
VSPDGPWPNSDLTIGELFPATDLVAQWVFTLNSVAEDIQVTMRPLKTTTELREQTYFYRLLITRLYEARRLIEARAKHKEIEEFAGGSLNFLGVDLVAAYSRPSPSERSEVEELYAQTRHRSVHYPCVGGAELQALLRDHRNLPARQVLVEYPDGLATESQWVTAIRVGDAIGGVPWDPEILALIGTWQRATSAIATAWLMASGVLTIVYAKRRGIDLDRLVDDADRWKKAVEARKAPPPGR